MSVNQIGLILMYHRIGDLEVDPWALAVTPQHFREHLQVLRALLTPIQTQQLLAMLDSQTLPDRFAVITFDDGYADNLHAAKPLLEAFDVPATVFVVTGDLGRKSEIWSDELEKLLLHPGTLPESIQTVVRGKKIAVSSNAIDYPEEVHSKHRKWKAWEDRPTDRHRLYYELWNELRPLPDLERERILAALRGYFHGEKIVRETHRVLSAEEVRLLESPLIEIGSHTVTHPYLSSLPLENQRNEITRSKLFLEELLGHEIRSFAYPYGGAEDYNAESVRVVREARFWGAVSTLPGCVYRSTDKFQLPRMQVQDWDGEEFAKQLSEWLSDKTASAWQA